VRAKRIKTFIYGRKCGREQSEPPKQKKMYLIIADKTLLEILFVGMHSVPKADHRQSIFSQLGHPLLVWALRAAAEIVEASLIDSFAQEVLGKGASQHVTLE
jgi:hypothetical protein